MKRYPAYPQRNSRSNNSSSGNYTPRSMRRIEKNAKKHLIWIILGIIVFGYLTVAYIFPFLVGGLTYFNRYKDVEQVENVVEDTAVAPPVLNIPFEATNTATISIKGYATSDAKVELYVGNDLKDTVGAKGDGSFEADLPMSEGVNAIYGKTILDNKSSLPSKAIRVEFSDQKPKLEVQEPTDNQEVKGGDKKIKVSGLTDPDNNITINGAYVIVNSEGKFSSDISINEGDNKITIQALNSYGSNTTIEKMVKYTP